MLCLHMALRLTCDNECGLTGQGGGVRRVCEHRRPQLRPFASLPVQGMFATPSSSNIQTSHIVKSWWHSLNDSSGWDWLPVLVRSDHEAGNPRSAFAGQRWSTHQPALSRRFWCPEHPWGLFHARRLHHAKHSLQSKASHACTTSHIPETPEGCAEPAGPEPGGQGALRPDKTFLNMLVL